MWSLPKSENQIDSIVLELQTKNFYYFMMQYFSDFFITHEDRELTLDKDPNFSQTWIFN